MAKIKEGDTVMMMRGKDAGKTGKVLRVLRPKKEGNKNTKVVVKGLNIVKKHQKPDPTRDIQGGIIEFERAVDISNVMYAEGGKPTRVGFVIDEKTGKKNRISKKDGKVIN